MKGLSILIAVLLLALSVGTALGQQQQQRGSMANQEPQRSGQTGQALLAKADSLKGSDVVDTQGQKLGKVDSVTLDLMTGGISHVTVDTGRGDKLIPVPYNNFGVLRNKQLVLNMDKDRLDAAPSYAKSAEPNWDNQQWAQQVAGYWGARPSGAMTGQAPSATSGSSQQPAAMSSGQPTEQQPMGASSQPPQQPVGSGSQPPGVSQPMGTGQPTPGSAP